MNPRHGVEASGVPYIQGHIEILHDGKWGTICNDRLNDAAASVLCKMAGYSHGGQYSKEYQQNLPNKATIIWLDDLTCKGTEVHVDQCRHRIWGSNDCSHSEDVGIRCFRSPSMYNYLVISFQSGCNFNKPLLSSFYACCHF